MKKKIICFGDSNTYGYDPRDYFGRPYDRPWPMILAEKTGYEVVNLGQPGREIPVLDRQFQYLERDLIKAGQIDVLLIMLGTNDLLNMSRPDACVAVQRMKQLLNFLHQRFPELRICLMIPPLIRENDAFLQASRQLGAECQKFSEPGRVDVLDTSEWDLSLAFDGIHISEESQDIFAEKVKEYFERKK